MTLWQTVMAIAGMPFISFLTRAFFMIPKEELPLPDWVKQGLRYAPLAALAAVIVPEIVMTEGHVISTWKDARLFAVLVGTLCFVWKRDILATILSGTAVMLLMRLALGW